MQYLMAPPGQHQLPKLPYAYNALEPVISSTLLRIHHDQHHKSYIEGLNKAELKLVEAHEVERRLDQAMHGLMSLVSNP